MQILSQNKKLALVLLLIAIIVVSIVVVVFVGNLNKSPSNPNVSPTPSTSHSPSPTPTAVATSSPTPFLYPDEVIKYQNQSLTPISGYINYVAQHPDVAIAGTQYLDQLSYRLTVNGLVNQTLSYRYVDVVFGFNSTQQVATLPCVEGWSVTFLWQGVPIKDILAQAGVNPNATTLIFSAADGYTTSLPLDYVNQNNIMIAYKINNVTLSPQTGWPFFLVSKDQYGYKWIEWLTAIDVSDDSSYLGYWESQGYPNNATVLDPQNTAQPLTIAPITVPAVTISIAFIAIAAAIVVARFKIKKEQKLSACFLGKSFSFQKSLSLKLFFNSVHSCLNGFG